MCEGKGKEVGGGGARCPSSPLMDGGHYGSWGQVPSTIKGPSQWLGKNGSGKRRGEGKGNCCRRTSKHKRCGESKPETSGAEEAEEEEGVQGR